MTSGGTATDWDGLFAWFRLRVYVGFTVVNARGSRSRM